MATKLLLLEDVDTLGRSGELVNVKPGYARNFLLPQGLAVMADKHALKMQDRLRQERQKQAEVDKKESEEAAGRLDGISVTKVVKVDQEGHMYGSVTVADIVQLVSEHYQIELDKKDIQLKHAIKTTGVHPIPVKLKEGVTASFNLKVMSEEGFRNAQAEQAAESASAVSAE
jgi:large subunit ribosomal protein L9